MSSRSRNTGFKKVLIADDEPSIRDILHKMLRSILDDQVEIFLATNGEEAVEIARRDCIGSAFVDVQMPKMGGLEACKELKSLNPTCKVIMMSGTADQNIIDAAMKEGASDYVSKPFSIKEIKKILEKY